MNNFYIYIYLDPRKPGKYEYGDYCFLYEPFYVGKGKGNRWKEFSGRNNYFKNKINKIKNYELEPIVIKLFDNIKEKKSIIFELKLIDLIGRKNLNNGPLINLTNGGEGITGYNHTKESKNKISKSRIGKYIGDKHPLFGLRKEKTPMYGKKHSEETKKKISESNKGKHDHNIEIRNRLSKINKGKILSDIHKKRISDSRKGITNGSRHPLSKIKEQDVIEIWKYLDEGILNQSEIGEIFNVKQSTISDIKTGRCWNHISRIRE